MSDSETIDSVHPEDYLTPPKYDATGFLMILIASFIVSVVSGIIIVLLAFLSLGKFSLESGASPILLAMIAFFGLSLGNILYYFLLSKIYPDIYVRGRTALGQITVMSILLYIFFAPVYILISSMILDPSVILIAFSLHILFNTLCLQLVIGLTSQYRYALLALYSSILSFLISSLITVYAYMSFSDSSNAIFVLLGLVIIAQVSGAFFSNLVGFLYALFYKSTGYDPIGSVFARIEEEEKNIENEATKFLTKFKS